MTNRELSQLLDATRSAAWHAAMRSFAHAVGTPLNVMLGHAELLLQELPDSTGAKSITKQVGAMETIVRRGVEFTAGSNARKTSDTRPDLAVRVCSLLEERVIERELRLELDEPPLAITTTRALVVLLALARFGVERAAPGTQVLVRSAQTTLRVAMTLECSGAARFAETARSLWEPWFADPVDDSPEGLELSVALSLVRRTGGVIELDADGGVRRLSVSWTM